MVRLEMIRMYLSRVRSIEIRSLSGEKDTHEDVDERRDDGGYMRCGARRRQRTRVHSGAERVMKGDAEAPGSRRMRHAAWCCLVRLIVSEVYLPLYTAQSRDAPFLKENLNGHSLCVKRVTERRIDCCKRLAQSTERARTYT